MLATPLLLYLYTMHLLILLQEIPSSSSEDDDELSGYSSSSSVGLRVPDDGGDMSRLTVDAQVTSAT